MSDNGVVDKVAARISLDLSPAQQALLQLTADIKKFATDASAAMDAGGQAQLQAQDKANQKLQQSQQLHEEKLKQIQMDGDLSRVMAANMVSQQLVQQAEDAALKRELAQKQSDQRMQLEQDKFAQQMLQSEQMFQERMSQLVAKRPQQNAGLQQGTVRSVINGTDTGFSTGKMIAGMVGFSAVMDAYESMVQGMKDVENGAAGLQQVFEQQITSQDQLNTVTNDFVGIAQKYGQSITEVMDGAKQWGRQYKDIQTAMTLTNSSTLLAIVDNVQLATANRGLEATMNAMGLAADNQSSAFANSMRIVDSWSALAHKASVSADDLVQATERSAGAAHQAGVTFDQLQALITSGVRNTGLEGANLGNMLKTLFSTIHTDKAQQELKNLDISLTQVGKDGQTEFKPVFDVLLELSQKLQTTDQSQQKLLKTISGGVQQYSKVASMLSDYNTIIDAYATSLNSAGAAQAYAQVQMHTLERDVTRLKDTFVQLAAQTDQNGLGSFLKGIVEGLTNLIVGFEQMPPAAGQALLVIGGLVVALKSFVSVMNTVDPVVKFVSNSVDLFKSKMAAATAATEAQTAASTGVAAASEAQAASSAAVVGALEAETAGATEATAAFTALDVASGGLVLVLGLAVTAIAGVAMSEGQATQATKDRTAAIQQQVGVAQQEYNLAQQKEQFMQTAIKQEQQLKQAYEDTTLSAQNRNKIMNDMIDLYHAVGKATDDEKLQQVNASNVKNQSLTSEEIKIRQLVDDKKKAYDQAVQINEKEAQSDLAKTNQEIADMNATIEGLQKETTAKLNELSVWDDVKVGWNYLKSALDFGAGNQAAGAQDLLNVQNIKDAAHKKQLDDANSQLADLRVKQANLQYQVAGDQLDAFQIDTGTLPGDDTGAKAVDAGWGATKPKAQSASSFAQPFKDNIFAFNEGLQHYTERTKNLDTAISDLTTRQQTLSDSLKYGSTNMTLAAQSTDIYHQRLVDLKEHQESLHATNDQIRADMAKIAAEMHAINPNNADPTTLSQGQQQALQSLSQEYDKLNTQLDDNGKKWTDDAKSMIQATDDWLNNLYALQQNGLTPLDNQLKDIENRIKGDQGSMTMADNNMKHGDTSDSQIFQYVSSYKDYLDQLIQKEQTLREEADKHREAINELQYTLNTLDPTMAGYSDAVQSLTDKINEHKAAVADLGDQWTQTAQEAQSATDTLMTMIEDSLKAGYQTEQKQQLDQLKEQYDTKINGLTAQKDAVDVLIQSLQQQWQLEDQNKKLADLEAQDANIKSNLDHVIVGTDGKVTRTYDTQQALQVEKQIADQQTQMARDRQKQQLEDQKTYLEQQIKAEQDEYNQKKQQLDDYWNYREQQDQLQQEADRLIIQKGYANALADAETFKNNMNAIYASINMAQINSGGAVSAGLGQVNAGSSSPSLQDIIQAAGKDWTAAKTQADKDAIHKKLTDTLYGSGATYNDKTGEWSAGGIILNGANAGKPVPKFANGGIVPNIGPGGVDTVPALMTPGEIVAPSFADIKNLALDAVKQSTSMTTIQKGQNTFQVTVYADDSNSVTRFLDLVHSV